MTEIFINNREENEYTRAIKDGNFHAGYSLGYGFETILMKKFDISQIKWLTYLPDPLFSVVGKLVHDTSSNLPAHYPFRNALTVDGMHTKISVRAFNLIATNLLEFFIDHLYLGMYRYKT